tara:strand:+ start:193 stop:486 length:294 start_codon:yes stop_codon:yes gene_type:complete
MKQKAARSFIAIYEEAGLLPEGSRLVVGGGGQSPRRFTLISTSIKDIKLGIDNVEIGWFHSVAELVATVACAVKLDVHDAVADSNFYSEVRAYRESE